MKVELTPKTLNSYFSHESVAIPDFRIDNNNISGYIKTDLFFDDTNEISKHVSTKEEEYTKGLLNLYPVFREIKAMFMLPAPQRVLAEKGKNAAFIYPELVFVVAPVKFVVDNGT